jgi:hypothetical protein
VERISTKQRGTITGDIDELIAVDIIHSLPKEYRDRIKPTSHRLTLAHFGAEEEDLHIPDAKTLIAAYKAVTGRDIEKEMERWNDGGSEGSREFIRNRKKGGRAIKMEVSIHYSSYRH